MNAYSIEQLENNPKNYRWGLFYACPDDPRVVVPKHVVWMGWTINFAHPRAWQTLLLFIVIATCPSLIADIALIQLTSKAIISAMLSAYIALLVMAVTILALIFLSYRLSSQTK